MENLDILERNDVLIDCAIRYYKEDKTLLILGNGKRVTITI